jgi:hypothetical protein
MPTIRLRLASTIRLRPALALAALLLAAGCGSVRRPAFAYSAPPSREACRAAVDALMRAAPSSDEFPAVLAAHSPAWCGDAGAAALAYAVAHAREVRPQALDLLVSEASGNRHPRILRAALDLAQDRAAAVPVRVAGIVIAMRQHEEIGFDGDVQTLVTRDTGPFCPWTLLDHHSGWVSVRRLAWGARRETIARLGRVAGDDTEPRIVRHLSSCVARYLYDH